MVKCRQRREKRALGEREVKEGYHENVMMMIGVFGRVDCNGHFAHENVLIRGQLCVKSLDKRCRFYGLN